MKGGRGRKEDTSLLEGLGVWTGLGLDLKPDTHHTTPTLQVNAMQRNYMSHHTERGEESVEAALQVSKTENTHAQTHTLCVSVYLKSK